MSDEQPMVDERELAALFARRRPDPQRFAAGVAQRLRDRERGGGQSSLQKAAAWLPISTTGSKFWIVLSLPIVFLASSWLVLIGSAGIIRSSLQKGADPTAKATAPPRRIIGEWQFSAQTVLLGPLKAIVRLFVAFVLLWLLLTTAMVTMLLLGWPYMFDGLILVSVLSMFALAMVVRREARRDRADRAHLARLCIAVLELLLLLTLISWTMEFRGVDPGQWVLASSLVVLAGVLALVRYAPLHAICSVAVAGYVMVLLQQPIHRTQQQEPVTLQQVQQYIAEPELGAVRTRLPHYVSVVQSLRAAGHEIAPPANLGTELVRRDDATFRYDSFVMTECARAGLLPESEWQRIGENRQIAYRLRKFVESAEQTLPRHYNEYLFRLLAARSPTDTERDRIVARLTANWPDDDSRSPLADCRLITNAIDWLGRSDLADAQRDLVHARLVRQQEGDGWRRGGFAELPSGTLDKPLPVNNVAMALIARFGLPPGLDVHSLHQHLQKQVLLPRSTALEVSHEAVVAFAHLQLLEARMGELPARSFARVLLDERLLWSMIAMVLLCLYTVRLAPRQVTGQQGAMP